MLSVLKRPRAAAATATLTAIALLALAGCDNAGSASTPAPTAITPQPTPTARPDGLRVTFVDFGDPVAGTIFEELLARFPDDHASREAVQFFDSAGIHAALGLEAPAPGASAEAWEQFIREAGARDGNLVVRLISLVPFWPSDMNSYLGQIDWYPDVAFDIGSVEQRASNQAARFLGMGGDPRHNYEIAFGKFDPAATEAALAACDCDQPDLNEYGGFTYYSWGEEFAQDLRKRLGRPLYDFLGRGPRLLVRDGETFWTFSNAMMEQHIDVLNGTRPSLAADADYMAAVRRMAAMGTMGDIALASRGFTIDDTPLEVDEISERILAAPLLKPFSAYASGTGYDGERIFDAIVVIHDDEATAQENVGLLLDRIGTIHPRAASEVEIEVEGRFLLLRAYEPTALGAPLIMPGHNLILIHE